MTAVRIACMTPVLLILFGPLAAIAESDPPPKLKFEVFTDKAGEHRWRRAVTGNWN